MRTFTLVGLAVAAALLRPQAPRSEILIADFEGPDYGAWMATGEAFGPGPARGNLPGQMAVSGYLGRGLVNSFYKGDATTGTLTSPEFTIERRFLNFLIGGGNAPGVTCMNLLVEGKAVRTSTGPNDRPGGSEQLNWQSWDVADLEGRRARVEIVDRATGGWGHINVDHITQSDKREAEEIATTPLYDETCRPQFHFSAQKGWLNDPNGLVYYAGEYHLFFQHNPLGTEWGNMTWGHAVSPDLVHWKQLGHALERDKMGTMFSGSAVVDWNNTAGFQKGKEKTLVAIYTAAGGTSPESKGQSFTQCIAYSNDRGRSWTKYTGNPVLPHVAGENRDPKVVWHAPTKKWIMALYLDKDEYAFYSSPNLKQWKELQRMKTPGLNECPDFFEMPVAGEPGTRKWVWTAANGSYIVGSFDGERFTPESGPHKADYGANFYAVQSYSDIPAPDGRRIQIGWMNNSSFPRMPFNQQMSFPCELTLHRTPRGFRINRWPVREIAKIGAQNFTVRSADIVPGSRLAKELVGDLWDISAEFELKDATEAGVIVRGQPVTYSAKDKMLRCLGREAPMEAVNGRIKLRILVDRASLEVFGNGGEVSMTSHVLFRQRDQGIVPFAEGGTARLVSMTATKLRSAWR